MGCKQAPPPREVNENRTLTWISEVINMHRLWKNDVDFTKGFYCTGFAEFSTFYVGNYFMPGIVFQFFLLIHY
jgi:hypothetical protein